MEAAISRMFAAMNEGLGRVQFELSNLRGQLIRELLVRFDAIFTLNQDLLLETHYLNDNIGFTEPRRWQGGAIPGMARGPVGTRTPNSAAFDLNTNIQPYMKLHGSSDWRIGSGSGSLLILGGEKAGEIDRYPLLKWYHEVFHEYLHRPATRLMVVGYSFGDSHINKSIESAASKQDFRLFVVDPLGADILDKRDPRAAIKPRPGPLLDALGPKVFGASRRPLRSVFRDDPIERARILSFLD
jgi:hypothetical protein